MDEIILENKPKLIKWLSPDYVLFLQYVQAKKLITTSQYSELRDMNGKNGVIELLDIIIGKGENVCRNFLDLLKEDDVNESSPELSEWIKTVDTTNQKIEKDCRRRERSNRPIQETAKITGQPGIHVIKSISAFDGSNVYSSTITGASIGSIQMNMTVAPSGRSDMLAKSQKPDKGCEHKPIKDYQKFLKNNFSLLVQKVKNIGPIIDDLIDELHGESVANVRTQSTDQDKMRKLLGCVNCESIAKDLFNALCKHEKRLMNELLSNY